MTKDSVERMARLASLLTVRQLSRVSYADASVGLTRDVARDVTALVAAARRLAKLAEHDCNYGLSERQRALRDATEAKVEAIAVEYGLTADISGDPRGYVVKLVGLPVSNELGGAWGVA